MSDMTDHTQRAKIIAERAIAARIWGEPQHSHKVIDIDLAESIAIQLAKAHADGRREAYEEVARDFHVEPSEVLPAGGEYVRGLAAQLEVVYLRKAEAVRAQAQKEGA